MITLRILRILHIEPYPESMMDWLDRHDYTEHVWRGKSSQNFWVNDLTFPDEEVALEFKLVFGELVFSEEDVFICDTPYESSRGRHTYGADKSRLYDRMAVLMKDFP